MPPRSARQRTPVRAALRQAEQREDPRRQHRGVLRVVDADGRHRDARRHLHDREQRVDARRARDIDERSGTPITGSSVCAATTPGSAAARPGAADQHLDAAPGRRPSRTRRRRRARGARSAPRAPTRSRARRARRVAPCSRSRSDSDPIRIPTSGSATCHRRDVPSRLRALERDEVDRRVGARRAPPRPCCRAPSRRGFCRRS